MREMMRMKVMKMVEVEPKYQIYKQVDKTKMDKANIVTIEAKAPTIKEAKELYEYVKRRR